MKNIKQLSVRIGSGFAAIVLLASYFAILQTPTANAAQITTRSLTLQAGATDGGSAPGGEVNHFFAFTLPGGSPVQSIQFEYCTTASDTPLSPTCITPTGLSTAGITLGAENGVTGFTMNNTTNGAPYIYRTNGTNLGTNVAVSYRLDGVTNPTTEDYTFFVRISTFATNDATGAETDTGTVTASTATPIELSGTMPESLVFCTGGTVGLTSSVPDCSTASVGTIGFDQLFSPTDTATATSQMAASTNAGFGYIITVNGTTLTSGSNTITANATPLTIVKGSGQFGLNLVENVTTTDNQAIPAPLGLDVAPAPDGTNLKGEAVGDYAIPDSFKFVTGNTVASSTNGGAGGTDAQIFTVSYIVNVPGNQPAGTYTTTLTYICTPTF